MKKFNYSNYKVITLVGSIVELREAFQGHIFGKNNSYAFFF